MAHNITTSVSDEDFKLAKSKGLKWSVCLRKGIQELAHKPLPTLPGNEKIIGEPTITSKIANLQTANYQLTKIIEELEEKHGSKIFEND